MESIKKYIYEQVAEQKLSVQAAKAMLMDIQNARQNQEEAVAVIGMACRVPGANNMEEFWNNLVSNNEMIRDFPENRKKDLEAYIEAYTGTKIEVKYSKGGYLDEIDKFDPEFFRISPREAKLMDPVQRLFLEVSFEALEDAGYGGKSIVGSKTGVFVGRDHTGDMSLYNQLTGESDTLSLTGSYTSILSGRVSYVFNLTGPSMVVDTACSSGLVAVHTACESLKRNECDMAIAGGVHLIMNPEGARGLDVVKSDDSKVRTFDKSANGTAWSEGVCALILKPLSKAMADKDSIYAVLKGSAINNDGASNGITAPNPEAQEAVILEALKNAGVEPETISYIEAHGTGTVLGDPIEIKAIKNAFGKYTTKKQFCGIGATKTNIGHMVAASGVGALMKVILSLQHNLIPGNLNFKEPNPYIEFTNTPVYIVDKNQEWKRSGEALRRAGVCSFGFSGTNCHVIVEEAQQQMQTESIDESKKHLFLLSGRNQVVLRQNIKNYLTYVRKNPDISIEDFCYTTTVGRGFYASRLAIIFRDMKELEKKLEAMLKQAEFQKDVAQEIFYGEHKVVKDQRAVLESFEITESDKRKIDQAAAEKMVGLSLENLTQIQELCELYVQGANVAWEKLYEGKNRTRLHLPVYPLERIRYWPQIRNKRVAKLHPLLDQVLANTMDRIIYSTVLQADSHWVLTDHKIAGNSLIPATAFLEMTAEAAIQSFGYKMFEFEDVFFFYPLAFAEDETREVQTILKLINGVVSEFVIVSKVISTDDEETDNWVIHAQGKVRRCSQERKRVEDVSSIVQRCKKESINSYGEQSEVSVKSEVNVHMGARWDNIKELYCSKDEAIIKLGLIDSLQNDTKDYFIHPALMDNAVNAFNHSFNQYLYLPYSYKSCRIYKKIPECFYSYVQKCEGNNMEAINFNIYLIDESGEVFAEITEYTIKKVRDIKTLYQQKFQANHMLHTLQWVSKPSSDSQESIDQGAVLIFADYQGTAAYIAEQLKAQSQKVIMVRLGNAFEQEAEDSYVIGNRQSDYDLLFTMIQEENISKILHFSCLSEEGEENVTYMESNVLSLFRLVKAMDANDYKQQVKLLVFSEGAYSITGEERVLKPVNASMIALGKVIAQENPNMRVRCIDFDVETAKVDIWKEIALEESAYSIAYRNGKRYTEELAKVNVRQIPDSGVTIKEDGVYIITGGAGDIGLKMADYLASQAKIHLCLIGRSDLSIREEEKQNALKELEKTGAEVIYRSGDVASLDDMKKIIDELRTSFGHIDGIIHCAGVTDDKLLLNKQEKDFQKVMNPKVLGTVNLDQLTNNDNLDFFILCSSMTAIAGGAGQSDYVSANAFLDGYASYMRRQGKNAIVINWPFWDNIGLARGYKEVAAKSIFSPISAEQGISAFACVLGKQMKQVLVGKWNMNINLNTERLAIQLSDEILHDLERANKTTEKYKGDNEQENNAIVLKGRGEGTYTPIEQKIAGIWSRVLELNQIDINDEIFDLGGDSIVAIKIVNEINEAFALSLSVKEVFEYPTVERMAAYIDSLGIGKKQKTTEAQEKNTDYMNKEKDEKIEKFVFLDD